MSPTPLNATAVASRIAGLPFPSRLDAVADVLAGLDPHAFDPAGSAAIVDALHASTKDAASAAARLGALRPSPAVAYACARLHAAAGDIENAAHWWTQFLELTPSRDALSLLHAARAFSAGEHWDAAASCLREGLATRPDFTFHARARGAVEQVVAHAGGSIRRARIAVLGSATTSLLIPVLKALCFRDRIEAECYEGLYGAYRQEILDPESGLHAFSPDVVIIAPSWRDLNLPSLTAGDDDRIVDGVVAEHVRLWDAIARGMRCHIVQHAFDVPATESAGGLSSQARGGRTRLIRRINLGLVDAAPRTVSVLDTERVVAEVGLHAWEDAALWQRARQHPSARALPALVEAQMAHVRAALGLTRKVVVCDLDNTLWGGVIGEDGLEGIRVGGSSPEGEAYAELQVYLRELRSRGILLAVVSKNNPDEARLPFTSHAGMVLALEDFAAFEANWDDKVTNLHRVAASLSLGTESFVFLDDNPLERAWVRSRMPEVAVVELGRSPAGYVHELDAGRYFEVLSVSDEDRERAERYRVEAQRETFRQGAGSLDEFLAGLHMQAGVAPITDANIARVTQLVNKTNQFNVTTRRYTEAQVRAIAAQPGWCGVFDLSDRFGRHGVVGLLFCVAAGEPGTWEIDTWLMSCRVLGRQLEGFMLDRALDAARLAGVTRLAGAYRPTAKNGLVADLFDRLRFTRIDGPGDDVRYELLVESATAPYSTFIEHGQSPSLAGERAGAARA